MRLWHEKLLSLLPRQQLLGQHRECAALLGKGWVKRHSTVQYALNQNLERLKAYHNRVIDEMNNRGYKVSQEWYDLKYRGKQIGLDNSINEEKVVQYYCDNGLVYKEHDNNYLQECIDNLKNKGINLVLNRNDFITEEV